MAVCAVQYVYETWTAGVYQ